jgi:hypothetical protein
MVVMAAFGIGVDMLICSAQVAVMSRCRRVLLLQGFGHPCQGDEVLLCVGMMMPLVSRRLE